MTDTDGDGMPDCFDLCPYDSDKIFPGVCGCGVSDVDTDGDSVPIAMMSVQTTQKNSTQQVNAAAVFQKAMRIVTVRAMRWTVVQMIRTKQSRRLRVWHSGLGFGHGRHVGLR